MSSLRLKLGPIQKLSHLHPFHYPQQSQRFTSVMASPLRIAHDQDHEAVTKGSEDLTQPRPGVPEWEVVLDGKGLRRGFRFKGFNKAWVS